MKVGERFHLRLARLEILRAQAASVPALAKNARTGHPSGVVVQTMKPEKGWATGPEPRAGLEARFYDFVVFSDKKRVEKLRYMHRNPVKRGLVLAPEQWRWSSYRHYAYGEAGLVVVNEPQRAEMRVRKIF